MLELAELRFKNIGRFVEEQTIDFTSFSSFAQIDGKNNNTGGSSGSGKSTVFMALDYLLGVNKRPATVLQSRYADDPIWVQALFYHYGESIVVTRTKSSIQVKKEEEILKGIKAEEFIDMMLGMPRELFRKIIHKRQKEGGFFLNFGPTDMHNFLIDCIGLSAFKKKYKILEERLTKITESMESFEEERSIDQSALSATQDAILALGLAPIQDMHQEVVNELKEKYDRSAVRLADVEKKCESIYREFSQSRPNITNSAYDVTAREALEKRREEIEAAINACFDREQERQTKTKASISDKKLTRSGIVSRINAGTRAKEDATKVALEIKSIRSQLCPTCSQSWEAEGSRAILEEKYDELKALKVIIDDYSKAFIERMELEREIDILEGQLTPVYDVSLPRLNDELGEVCGKILEEKEKAGELYEQQNAETKKILDDFGQKMHELQAKHQLEIKQVRGQVEIDRRVYDLAVQKLKSYEEARFRFEKTLNELKYKETVLCGKITKYVVELEVLSAEHSKASESLKAAKTYISFSFDQALDDISEKATKIIRCIPNMKNATIQFEGTKESKDGKVKEEVNAVISTDGEPAVPIKSLSGGEESAMDLAVDLAVIDYIETRSGMGMNLFILDEPFNGLGTVEIEMALDVLKNSNTNKKLIVVDHNPEVKQMVQSRLVVERNGLYSKVAL